VLTDRNRRYRRLHHLETADSNADGVATFTSPPSSPDLGDHPPGLPGQSEAVTTWWARLRSSFLFLPGALCLLAVVLAEALIFLDRRLGDVELGWFGVVLTRVGESGSRDLLEAIAGSMLTVASTTFSITVAVLALSSSTYGPRLVRNFMADRGNQFVLGVFVATFLYSLLVLRSIRVIGGSGQDGSSGQDIDDYFVPHLAVNAAVLLAVLAIGVLVYFIHHISDSVQVSTLARQVRTDLLDAVDRLYPQQIGDGANPLADANGKVSVETLGAGGVAVPARAIGYVQAVDHDELLALAVKADLVVSLPVRPGSHTLDGTPLAVVSPAARVDEQVCAGLRKAFRIGQARTPDQDVEFTVLVLEEMAVRALSPSTNDPYTALNALDDLSAGLVRLAGRPEPSPYRYDQQGCLRVVAPAITLTELLGHVLDAMRLYALEHPTVLHRTLELVEQVGQASHQPALRRRLDVQVQRLLEAFAGSSPQRCDAEALNRHADQVRRSLSGGVVSDHPERR